MKQFGIAVLLLCGMAMGQDGGRICPVPPQGTANLMCTSPCLKGYREVGPYCEKVKAKPAHRKPAMCHASCNTNGECATSGDCKTVPNFIPMTHEFTRAFASAAPQHLQSDGAGNLSSASPIMLGQDAHSLDADSWVECNRDNCAVQPTPYRTGSEARPAAKRCAFDLKPQTILDTRPAKPKPASEMFPQPGPYATFSVYIAPPMRTVCPYERAIELFGEERVRYEDAEEDHGHVTGHDCRSNDALRGDYHCIGMSKRVLVDGEEVYHEP